MIEQDLRTYLLSQSAVSALIGQRMYIARLPQKATLPAITYQRISRETSETHDGATDLGRARIQIDCWAETYDVMNQLAKAVRRALSGYRGAMGATGVAATRVVNEVDFPDPDLAIWRRMVEAAVWHRED